MSTGDAFGDALGIDKAAQDRETQQRFMDATRPDPRPPLPDCEVLLIDLSSLYWANWHATADQEVSEAFKRTVAQVQSFADGYDHVAICCDAPPYTYRKELLPEYKANREAAPPMAREQLRRVKDRLEADGFLLWEVKGFEADDVIATATRKIDRSTMIVSSDKDLRQLVCEADDTGGHVFVTSPASGETYDVARVKEKHGVYPHHMRDFLALCGDSSDNIPGVPGIGPKTAAALLSAFGTLDAILAAAADAKDTRITKPKVRAALVDHAAAAMLSARVVELQYDVPIKAEEIFMQREAKPLTETKAADLDDDGDEPNGNGHRAPSEPPAAVVVQPPQAAPTPTAHALATRTLADASWSLALEPRSSKGAWEAAAILHNSRLYQQLGSQEAIYAVLLRGRALGMDATTSLSVFHNVKGKIAMHADLIEALVLRSGKAEYFEMVESSAQSATYATKRVGGRREQTLTFTIEDACAAGLVNRDPKGQDGFLGISESGKPSNWDKWRATMLRHRCKTQLARAVYADVVLGLYSPDEIEPERDFVEARVA